MGVYGGARDELQGMGCSSSKPGSYSHHEAEAAAARDLKPLFALPPTSFNPLLLSFAPQNRTLAAGGAVDARKLLQDASAQAQSAASASGGGQAQAQAQAVAESIGSGNAQVCRLVGSVGPS